MAKPIPEGKRLFYTFEVWGKDKTMISGVSHDPETRDEQLGLARDFVGNRVFGYTVGTIAATDIEKAGERARSHKYHDSEDFGYEEDAT